MQNCSSLVQTVQKLKGVGGSDFLNALYIYLLSFRSLPLFVSLLYFPSHYLLFSYVNILIMLTCFVPISQYNILTPYRYLLSTLSFPPSFSSILPFLLPLSLQYIMF
uniref:Uncharacterized protein n=1 Tax=Cacopsylla melanoneura TaxID=428564 RepID=A0A8D8ZE90_9HEMI